MKATELRKMLDETIKAHGDFYLATFLHDIFGREKPHKITGAKELFQLAGNKKLFMNLVVGRELKNEEK